MRRWLRRARAAAGLGTLWGLVGASVGAIGGTIAGMLAGSGLAYFVSLFMGYGGSLGFLLGAGFSVVVSLLGDRRSLERLSTKPAARFGALAGGILPFAWLLLPSGELLTDLTALPLGQFGLVLLAAWVSCAALGASLAAGSIAVAELSHSPTKQIDT